MSHTTIEANAIEPSSGIARDKLLAAFAEEGYVVLKGFFTPEIVRSAREAISVLVDRQADKLMAEGKISEPLRDEPFETRLYRLYRNRLEEAPLVFRKELHLAGLFPIFFNKELLDIIELFLGKEILLYPNYSVRPKFPRFEKGEVLWHQDGGYTDQKITVGSAKAETLRMINVWSPLVPAHVEHGCMQFIPGTHKLGGVPHSPRPGVNWLEVASEYLEPRRKDAISIEMDPGDVVLFHNLLFHQGLPNTSSIIRWNLDWRYLDATQPTLREQKGHLARSARHPEGAVHDAADWTHRIFG